MEVQETIQGTTRMNSQMIKAMKVKDRLHLEIRKAFIPEMVLSLSDDAIYPFVQRANMAYDRGLLEGLRIFICYNRARQFLLWLIHQSLHMDTECKYCPFLDSIYDVLDSFFQVPQSFEFSVVKIT
ncbi:hypothetical protein LCGC14_0869810 [marine sediment metagenome]|uniref:Uncharacterized protein n=1 Tax=marine sediment metagenome TaxID=412755 RepID=A0A0F9P9U2_9ZZZZ